MKKKRKYILWILLFLWMVGILFWVKGGMCFWSGVQVIKGKKTVAERLEQYGQSADGIYKRP